MKRKPPKSQRNHGRASILEGAVSHPKVHQMKSVLDPQHQDSFLIFFKVRPSDGGRISHSFDSKKSRCSESEVNIV